LGSEKTGETSGALFGHKLEVFGNLTTWRQRTPLRRHTLDVPAELNLFDEERIASLTVRCAFIGKVDRVSFSQLLRRRERLRVSHVIRLHLKTVPQIC
jgi:hypothetical protein